MRRTRGAEPTMIGEGATGLQRGLQGSARTSIQRTQELQQVTCVARAKQLVIGVKEGGSGSGMGGSGNDQNREGGSNDREVGTDGE
jgi:hypothetical protein